MFMFKYAYSWITTILMVKRNTDKKLMEVITPLRIGVNVLLTKRDLGSLTQVALNGNPCMYKAEIRLSV